MNVKYPHFGRINQLYPNPEIMLGHNIDWTLKIDGSNTGIYYDDNDEIKIRSRNMDIAMFYQKVENIDVYQNIVDMMRHQHDEFNNDIVVFGELLSKGRSPTGLKTFDRDEFLVFDIFDCKHNRFYSYDTVAFTCGCFDVPVVELIGKCNVSNIDDLYGYRDEMLEATMGEEGIVGKIYQNVHQSNQDNFLFVKEKHFVPKIRIKRSKDPKIILPQLDQGEIRKCIAKVCDELSFEDFKSTKVAMPAIAKEVGIECKQQNCVNKENLFGYYSEKLSEL